MLPALKWMAERADTWIPDRHASRAVWDDI
jgi:hypothetical protein